MQVKMPLGRVGTNTLEVEVCLLERSGVVIHQINAVSGAPILVEKSACPVSAQREVDDDICRRKVLVRIASRRVGEVGTRHTPRIRGHLGQSLLHLLRHILVLPRPEPHLDPRRRPLNSVPPTPSLVERRTVAIGCGELDGAAGVGVDVGVAVVEDLLAELAGAAFGHDATGTGVECCGVRTIVVDAFEDVEFTACGPVERVDFPDGGPGAAALGHMPDVEADKRRK